jgi:hypothetical protein
MAIVFADRVKVRSQTTGTGTLTLDSSVTGFQGFEAVGNGNECYYGIEDAAGNWEVGIGTYTSAGNTLSRDTVVSSSNSNALVNFPHGGKTVFTTLPSSVAANIVASTTLSFRDIEVAGQTTVSADSTADTLTLVAGSGVSITTDALSDTITISSNSGFSNGAIQRDTPVVTCAGNASTVVYTTTAHNQHTIKLLIQVEGTVGVSPDMDTQACEMIIAKSFRGPTVVASVYGVVYTSVAPLATFSADWNTLTSRVDVVCTTPSSDSVNVKIFATEITTSD